MIKLLIIALLVLITGCSSISKKSWASAGAADAFKITMVDPNSGQPLPSMVAGGGCSVMGFALPIKKDQKYPCLFGYARRRSMWGMFSGSSTGNVAFFYIAGSHETPEQTVKILEAMAKVLK